MQIFAVWIGGGASNKRAIMDKPLNGQLRNSARKKADTALLYTYRQYGSTFIPFRVTGVRNGSFPFAPNTAKQQ